MIYAEVDLTDDGVNEIHPLKSGEYNPSPVIYLKGKLLDRQQLAEDYPEIAANIIRQMNDDDLNYVVSVFGKFKPFSKGDLFWPRIDHQNIYYERYGRGN